MALSGTLLADFSAFRNEANASADSLKQMQGAADTTAAKLSRIGDSVNIGQTVTQPVTAATTSVEGLSESMGSLVELGTLAGSALVLVGTAAIGLATNAARTVSVFDDLHDKTDMSVPALSRLSNASQVIGADLGSLTNIVEKLEEGIGKNSTAFQKGLAAMGLSTEALKSAGPDRYLELVTAGLQGIPDPTARAAAGTEVLGGHYRTMIATLNDLDTGLKLTADIQPFTAQEAADAEAFTFQIASLKTHVSNLATELGTALIPAVSGTLSVLTRTAEGLVHIADLGGLVSGAWHGIKLSLGEGALAAETFNAVAATTNRLFAETGASAESVADKMLAMGFSEKTVAEQTGLTADKVRELNTELTKSKGAADDYTALWGRLNTALAQGPPSLDGVSLSMRGLALDMKEAGAKMADITAATGVTAAQMSLIDKNASAARASFQAFTTAVDNVNASMVGWQTTLGTMDDATIQSIKVALSAGASQGDLAKMYDLTAAQIKAVSIALDEDSKAMTANADMAVLAGKRRKEIIEQTTKATNDAVIATLERQKKEEAYSAWALADAQEQDKRTIAYQQSLGATTTVQQTELQKRAAAAKAAYDEAYRDASISQDKINNLSRTWQDANAAASAEVRSSATSTADTIGNAFSLNFQRSANEFDNFRGVVVAGTGEMIAGLTAFHDSGAYVQMQTDMRDAQNARGGFYIDTGFAPPPIQTRDSGGAVVGGTSYLIGGGKAPEIFTPGANGFITPGAVVGTGSKPQIINQIYITQPLGTPDAIARAVSDALTTSAKGQGARLPYA